MNENFRIGPEGYQQEISIVGGFCSRCNTTWSHLSTEEYFHECPEETFVRKLKTLKEEYKYKEINLADRMLDLMIEYFGKE